MTRRKREEQPERENKMIRDLSLIIAEKDATIARLEQEVLRLRAQSGRAGAREGL